MLVVIAEKEELKLVEELGYGDYPVLITGVGGMNVIRALKHLPKDTEIVNIGYCGSNHFKIGETLVIDKVGTQHEIAEFEELRQQCFCTNGYKVAHCYTATDFVTQTNKKERCVFDMELAFICSMFDNVMSFKVVSDNLNKEDYEKNIKK